MGCKKGRSFLRLIEKRRIKAGEGFLSGQFTKGENDVRDVSDYRFSRPVRVDMPNGISRRQIRRQYLSGAVVMTIALALISLLGMISGGVICKGFSDA